MSLKFWLMRLSTLSRLSAAIPGAKVSPIVWPVPLDSIDVGRSRRGSKLPDLLEDTIAATLMLAADGDIAPWGTMLEVIGEGVLSCDEDW
jgi:hypothetical protein